MKTATDEVKRALRALYNPVEGERNNAASLYYRSLIRLGVHPDDILISVGDAAYDNLTELNRFFEQRLNAAVREIEYWRRTATPSDLKKALEATEIEYRWPDLEDLIRDRVTGESDGEPLKLGWKKKVCHALDVNMSTLARWQSGVEQIPETAFHALKRLPAAPRDVHWQEGRISDGEIDIQPKRVRTPKDTTKPKPSSTGERRGDRENYYPWNTTEGAFEFAASSFEKGWSTAVIAERLVAKFGVPCTTNQINELIYNAAPRIPFSVLPDTSSEPLSWGEAWQIGGTLWGSSWKTKMMRELGLRVILAPPMLLDAPMDKIRRLRKQYHNKRDENMEKLRRSGDRRMQNSSEPTAFLEAIRAAGKDGATVSEAAERLGWTGKWQKGNHGRTADLARQFHIFEIGPRPGRSGPVWVATEYGSLYPKEFAIAKETYEQHRGKVHYIRS